LENIDDYFYVYMMTRFLSSLFIFFSLLFNALTPFQSRPGGGKTGVKFGYLASPLPQKSKEKN
jgi:hypothetical protein